MYDHFHKMHAIGKYAAICLSIIGEEIRPGMTAAMIDNYVSWYAQRHGLGCPQKGFTGNLSEKPFPGHCCVSINDEVCHGIPTEHKVLQIGDLVKVDITFTDAEGWHGDTCATFEVDFPNKKADPEPLITHGFLAMNAGIAAVKVGQPISDIGAAIEKYVQDKGYSVVQEFCGHSIGKEFHGSLKIPHYYYPDFDDSKVIMKPGMMFTIEPMITEGNADIMIEENEWTITTQDSGWAAQFEHTLGIDEDGKVHIFTLT